VCGEEVLSEDEWWEEENLEEIFEEGVFVNEFKKNSIIKIFYGNKPN